MVTRNRARDRLILFGSGVVFLLVILGIAIFVPNPSEFAASVFWVVLALAGAGFSAFLPGALNVELPLGAKAGGALAVFLIIYFFGPSIQNYVNVSGVANVVGDTAGDVSIEVNSP
jgi:hypothetical protein